MNSLEISLKFDMNDALWIHGMLVLGVRFNMVQLDYVSVDFLLDLKMN